MENTLREVEIPHAEKKHLESLYIRPANEDDASHQHKSQETGNNKSYKPMEKEEPLKENEINFSIITPTSKAINIKLIRDPLKSLYQYKVEALTKADIPIAHLPLPIAEDHLTWEQIEAKNPQSIDKDNKIKKYGFILPKKEFPLSTIYKNASNFIKVDTSMTIAQIKKMCNHNLFMEAHVYLNNRGKIDVKLAENHMFLFDFYPLISNIGFSNSKVVDKVLFRNLVVMWPNGENEKIIMNEEIEIPKSSTFLDATAILKNAIEKESMLIEKSKSNGEYYPSINSTSSSSEGIESKEAADKYDSSLEDILEYYQQEQYVLFVGKQKDETNKTQMFNFDIADRFRDRCAIFDVIDVALDFNNSIPVNVKTEQTDQTVFPGIKIKKIWNYAQMKKQISDQLPDLKLVLDEAVIVCDDTIMKSADDFRNIKSNSIISFIYPQKFIKTLAPETKEKLEEYVNEKSPIVEQTTESQTKESTPSTNLFSESSFADIHLQIVEPLTEEDETLIFESQNVVFSQSPPKSIEISPIVQNENEKIVPKQQVIEESIPQPKIVEKDIINETKSTEPQYDVHEEKEKNLYQTNDMELIRSQFTGKTDPVLTDDEIKLALQDANQDVVETIMV